MVRLVDNQLKYSKRHHRICLVFVLIFIISTIGCVKSVQFKRSCVPVLLPYSQYDLIPHTVMLDKTPSLISDKPVTMNILETKVLSPEGWLYDQFSARSVKFFQGEKIFSLTLTEDEPFAFDQIAVDDIKILGCKDFTVEAVTKTMYDFYHDLYLRTSKDFTVDQGFWIYWILYNKTKFFEKWSDLYYFKGEKLIAFERSVGDKDSESREIIIFFKDRIGQDYFSVEANFKDDFFVKNFLEALSALN